MLAPSMYGKGRRGPHAPTRPSPFPRSPPTHRGAFPFMAEGLPNGGEVAIVINGPLANGWLPPPRTSHLANEVQPSKTKRKESNG